MNSDVCRTTLVLAVIAGFLGGILSGVLLRSDPVIAKESSKPVDVIRAKEVLIVDDGGNILARLGMDPVTDIDGNKTFGASLEIRPALFSLNNIKLGLGTALQPYFYMSDLLSSTTITSTGLLLKDDQGRQSHLLGGGAAYRNKSGKAQIAFGIDEGGAASLFIGDADGKARAVLGVTDLVKSKTGATERTAPSSLVLFDKDNKVFWKTP